MHCAVAGFSAYGVGSPLVTLAGPLLRPPASYPHAADSRRYLRIPLSALVRASMNAGRENSRSAYFMSGAAGLGSWIP
jgi:hypothetical protein